MNAPDPIADLDAIVARARAAQQTYEANGSQARYDRAAEAVAWAIMEPERNRTFWPSLRSRPPAWAMCPTRSPRTTARRLA